MQIRHPRGKANPKGERQANCSKVLLANLPFAILSRASVRSLWAAYALAKEASGPVTVAKEIATGVLKTTMDGIQRQNQGDSIGRGQCLDPEHKCGLATEAGYHAGRDRPRMLVFDPDR
jgi:hypothetical protein